MEQWYVYCKKADFSAIAQRFNITPMTARILRNRDLVTDEDIQAFLYDGCESMHDPFRMKGMEEGVRLALETFHRGGRVLIVGDYDTDGICASLILKSFFDILGNGARVLLPNRMEDGYGINEEMVEQAREEGCSLIITCDNGISAFPAAERAKELGIPLIITDHHVPQEELPSADIIIDPKQKDCPYPYKELCGAAVAYKFIQAASLAALEQGAGITQVQRDELLERMLLYAGIATIADIVPLSGENRIFAKEGIKGLRNTDNIGLNALIEKRQIRKEQISSYHVGFVIAPCLNAAGRLADAGLSLELLLEQDPLRAEELAETLSDLNEERKKLTAEQTELAIEMIRERKMDSDPEIKVLVVNLPHAHESIAGIIAGRLKDLYYRPVLVLTQSEDGIKGSGRSIESYNLIDALSEHPELFRKFGGHAMACGFTLDCSAEKLSAELNRSCKLEEKDFIHKVWIDMQLPFRYLSEEFVNELEELEPFGTGNEQPLFAEKDLRILHADSIGKSMNVLRLTLEDPFGMRMQAVKFSSAKETAEELSEIRETLEKQGEQARFSILYYPQVNEFRGTRTIQLRLRSIRPQNG